MSITIDRRVILGGQTRRRGILSGGRSPVEWAGLALTGVWVVPLLIGGEQTLGRVVAAALVLIVAVALWTPFAMLANRSVAAWVVWQVRYLARRGRGAVYVPTVRAGRVELPEPVGTVRVLQGAVNAAPMAMLRHANPGGRHFYTVAFEMRGDSGGVETEFSFGRVHHDWGRFCATLAQQGSAVRSVQQVTRVVPYDTADHCMWAAQRIPAGTAAALTASYVELLDHAAATTEQHRTWLVLRMPVTTAFQLKARRYAPGDEGEVRLVEQEVTAAAHFATQHGFALRCLDEARLASVLRALQDPDHPIDDVAEMDFTQAWLPWDATARGAVTIGGSQTPWYSRTAVVPVDGIAGGWLTPDFLHPLLADVSPSIVRTISTVIALVPNEKAASRARHDVTLDTSASREALSRVSDGSEHEQLTVSQQRLVDLRPGTGHQGAGWGMSITIAARTLDALEQASRQITATAAAAQLTKLRWLDGWQDAGLTLSLPLARGVKA